MADSTIPHVKPRRNDLTAEYVRSIIEYDKDTGICRWKRRDDVENWVNSQRSGKVIGSKNANGTLSVRINKKSYLLHRIIWLIVTGEWPADQVDHKNVKNSDNRWDNLREASQKQNSRNVHIKPFNKSGIKGVSFYAINGKWRAFIMVDRKFIHLGYFDCKEEARQAYIDAAKKFFGEFARFE